MPPTDASTDADSTPAATISPTGTDSEDTLDLRLPDELLALFAEDAVTSGAQPGAKSGHSGADPGPFPDGDLLDDVADWGPVPSAAGVFQLVPVRIDRDLPLLTRWMNDPAVAEFWGSPEPAPSPRPISARNSTATAAACPASVCSRAPR